MSLSIGIDVGGTTIKSALVSADGMMVASHTSVTPEGVPALLDEVASHVEELELRAVRIGQPVSASVGVVVPGVVDESEGTAVLSANLGWQDVPMADLLTRRLGRHVSFGHDVRAGALAEFAASQPHDVEVYVAIGTGIAAVTKCGDKILVNGGWAGEIGQILVLDPDTGRRVPLERVSSASAIARRYTTATNAQAATNTLDEIGSREVFEAAAAGDATARKVLDTAIEYLAEALASVCCLLGKTHFIIGGGLSQAGSAFIDPLAHAVCGLLEVTPEPTFAAAKLGASSQIIGAAMLARNPQTIEVTA